MGEEEKASSSLAYVQLEKQNERMKEALLRLRDMSAENDAEVRRRIGELERDLVGVEEMRGAFLPFLPFSVCVGDTDTRWQRDTTRPRHGS